MNKEINIFEPDKINIIDTKREFKFTLNGTEIHNVSEYSIKRNADKFNDEILIKLIGSDISLQLETE